MAMATITVLVGIGHLTFKTINTVHRIITTEVMVEGITCNSIITLTTTMEITWATIITITAIIIIFRVLLVLKMELETRTILAILQLAKGIIILAAKVALQVSMARSVYKGSAI